MFRGVIKGVTHSSSAIPRWAGSSTRTTKYGPPQNDEEIFFLFPNKESVRERERRASTSKSFLFVFSVAHVVGGEEEEEAV